MSENTLIEKIRQDTAAQVAAIKAASDKKIAGLDAKAEKRVVDLQATHTTELQKKKDHLELVAVSRAKQAGKIAVQQVRRNQIDAIFTDFETEVAAQSADDYVTFFKKYTVSALPEKVEMTKVTTAESRKDEATQIVKEFGFAGEVETDSRIKAGLVIETKEGVYDITLKRLMGEKRAELEMQVAKAITK